MPTQTPKTPTEYSSGPLRLLLIDDKPDPYRTIPESGPELQAHVIPTGSLTNRLQVFWISNPHQARVLLNSLEHLFMAEQESLSAIPFPPELFIFDYALTQDDRSHFRSIDDPTNPFPLLKSAIDALGTNHAPSIDEEGGLYEGPLPEGDPGSDRFGCFIGGTFARLFHGHPCANVPTTAHERTSLPDVAFFRWFNEQYFQGGFDDEQRRTINWRIITNVAVPIFRRNFIQFLTYGHVELLPSSFNHLSAFGSDPENDSLCLSFRSRFGVRQVPLASVFCDEHSTLEDAVGQFSKDLLDAYVSRQITYRPRLVASQVQSAADIAAQYDHHSITDVSCDRYELSNAVSEILLGNRPKDDPRFLELCEAAAITSKTVLSDVKSVEVPTGIKPLPYNAECEHPRLALLFLMVRLSQRSKLSDPDSIDLVDSLTDDEILDGTVLREDLIDRIGLERTRRLLENHRIAFLDGEGPFAIPFMHELEYSDLWTAIDPLPRSVLTFENRSQEFGRDTSSLTKAIERKCDGLKLSNVLEPSRSKNLSGLQIGEGAILRGYASEIGFSSDQWPLWLRQAI